MYPAKNCVPLIRNKYIEKNLLTNSWHIFVKQANKI